MATWYDKGNFVFKDLESYKIFIDKVVDYFEIGCTDEEQDSLLSWEYSENEWERIKQTYDEGGNAFSRYLCFSAPYVKGKINDNDGSLDLYDLIVDGNSPYTYRKVPINQKIFNELIETKHLVPKKVNPKQLTFWNAKAGMYITNAGARNCTFKLREIRHVCGSEIVLCNGSKITTDSQCSYWSILENSEVEPLYKEYFEAYEDTHTFYKKWVEKQIKAVKVEPPQENTTMQKLKQTAVATAVANKSAGIEAAKLKVGKTANNAAAKMIKPKLPMGFKGAADHPLFKIAIANAASFAVQQIGSQNPKALAITEAMMPSAYYELVDQIDVEGMLDELLGKFNGSAVDKLVEAKAEQITIDE